MSHKKRVLLLLLVLLALAVPHLTTHAGDGREKSVLVVAGDDNFPPYEFLDTINGATVYRGFNVDLLRSIALSTGYEIQFRPMPWSDALQALERGEVDAIGGMKFHAEREALFDFSDFYMINSLAIFVRKETHTVASIDDLAGKTVAVQKNDFSYERLRHKPVNLVLTANQEEALHLLHSQMVDASLGNKLTGQYILQRKMQLDAIKIVGGAIDPERYCVAVRKGNPVLAIFNNGLRDIKQNGTYDKLYAKWFGEPIDYPGQYYKRNFHIAILVVVILFVLATLIIQANLFLKREVKRRTQEIQNVNDELRRKNEYIEKTRQYQEKMLNSGYSGIVTIAQNGGIKFANRYAERYLSQDGNSLAGKHYRETKLGDVIRDLPFDDKIVGRVEEVMLGPLSLEYHNDILPLSDEKDSIVYFRDVTQEKSLREEVIRKDKLEALGKLVACIAHEIRTPLTSIKTFAELLPDKHNNPRFREKFSEFVPQEIERLNNIVNDLLTYAHPRETVPEAVPLKSLINGLMVFFSDAISKQEIDLQIRIDDDVIVCVDVQQMKQVMINILLNAVQALKERTNPCLYIIGTVKDGFPCLRVVDNGVGIHHDHINNIFEPFFTTKSGGTGLGLFVSYQLAKQNGVSIIIDSKADIGTQVMLQFNAKENIYGEDSHCG